MTDSFAYVPVARAATVERQPDLSDILLRLTLGDSARITLGDLAQALGARSFGAFLAIFALPNLIPAPPGTTFFLGLPLIFVTWQMLASPRAGLWLPPRLAACSMDRAQFSGFAMRALPWLRKGERFIRPRLALVQSRLAERVVGFFALLLAIVVFLPIPGGNWLPALSLSIIGLTLSQRDGLGVILGLVVGVVALAVVAMILAAAGALVALIV